MHFSYSLLAFLLNHASIIQAASNARTNKGLEKITYVRHQFGMELGSGYDNTNDVVVQNMIEPDARTSNNIVQQYVQRSTFDWKLVNSIKEVRDMLGISGRVSLTVGEEGVVGSSVAIEGHYLNDASINSNELMVAAVFRYKTIAKTIPDAALKGRGDCARMKAETRGTHFVRSIIYGGEVVASIKITMRSKTVIDQYGGSVKASTITGFNFNAYIEHMTKNVNSEVKTDIKIMASCGVPSIPGNITTFEDLVRNFPTYISRNCPSGHPLQAELVPISYLKSCSSAGLGNPPDLSVNDWELRPLFDYVAVLYDDVKVARRKLNEVLQMMDTVPLDKDSVGLIDKLDMDLMVRELKLLESQDQLKTSDMTKLYNLGIALKDYYQKDIKPIPRHFEREVYRIRNKIGHCPYGFHNVLGNCFRLIDNKEVWYDANQRCARYGGFLASFTPEEIPVFKTKATTNEPFWIGLNRTKEGILSWVDDEPMVKMSLVSLVPYAENKHCHAMSADMRQAQQFYCSEKKKFACRISL